MSADFRNREREADEHQADKRFHRAMENSGPSGTAYTERELAIADEVLRRFRRRGQLTRLMVAACVRNVERKECE